MKFTEVHCRYIFEYLQHHKGDSKDVQPMERPLKHRTMKENIDKKNFWDAKWIDEIGAHRKDLFDLGMTAEKLKIAPLKDLVCAKIACLVKGARNEDIAKILDDRITDGRVFLDEH